MKRYHIEGSSLSSFLHRIAYNIFIDKYRKQKREEKTLDSWLYKRLNQLIKQDDDIKKEKIKHLEQAIEKLPPRCKEIFMLSKFEGLKYQEIADKLEISIKTVEVQMGKAFRLIREKINKKHHLFLFIDFKLNYNSGLINSFLLSQINKFIYYRNKLRSYVLASKNI